MSALESRIKELVQYARSHDGEDRSSLYANLFDLFLSGKAPPKAAARQHLLEVITALMPHVDPEIRRSMAEKLVRMPEPPLDLVIQICRDRANLVAGLLRHARLSEDDLIELIEATGREHHQIISTREDLTANAWIALARAAPMAERTPAPSTTELWRDDLGVSEGATVTPLRTDRPMRPQRPREDQRTPARLRILRMDEDLISAPVQEKSLGIGDSFEPDPHDFPLPPEPAPEPASTPVAEERPSYTAPSLSDMAAGTDLTAPMSDPGPGGWAWRADRDGFVVALSPSGPIILGKPEGRLKGEAMLDLLGLNAKLGHPIARALQRRSPIHDGPLYLSHLEKSRRYWTLDATPLFHPQSGVFEGYEGFLTPVRAENDDPQDETDLFLPRAEDLEPSQLGHRPLGETITKAEAGPSGARAPTEPAAPAQKAPGLDSLLSESTSDLLRDVLANAFPHQANDTESADWSTSETVAGAPRASEPAALPRTEPADALFAEPDQTRYEDQETRTGPDQMPTNASLERTFALLNQALDHLINEGRRSGDLTVRLQAEIARACTKVLREHLKLDDTSN